MGQRGLLALPRTKAVRRRSCATGLLALIAWLSMVAASASPAAAQFTRSSVRQVAGTPTGAKGEEVALGRLLGLATDSAGNLWAGNELGVGEHELDEFDPTGVYLKSVALSAEQVAPDSLAVSSSTGNLFVAGITAAEAVRIEVFESSGTLTPISFGSFDTQIQIAVDNSTNPLDPSVGDVYVAREGGATPGIEKFSPTGEALAFEAIKTSEIKGQFSSLAVDGEGMLYAVSASDVSDTRTIEKFNPGGEHLASLTGEGTPGLGGASDRGGWGGRVRGLAVDPTDNHVLVAVADAVRNLGSVDEFDEAGQFLGQLTTVTAPSALPTTCGAARAPFLRSAFQVAVGATSQVWVADRESKDTCEHAIDVYGPGRFLPTVKLGETSERTPTSVVLNGAVNPEGQQLSECRFEYVSDEAFAKEGFLSAKTSACVPAAATIASDQKIHAVTAKVSGLAAGTAYRYRLVATSAGVLGGTTESESLAFTAPAPPSIISTATTNVSSTFADLHASLNPRGSSTTYYFQYVDAAHYAPGAEDPYAAGLRAPAVALDIGSGGPTGSALASVMQQVGGLLPGTDYHLRVVASNAYGTVAGLDRTFTTVPQVVPGLPDSRAYELVTPAGKESASDMFGTGETFFNSDVGYPSASGEQYLMTNTLAAFGASPASDHNAYLFSLTSTGWRTTPLASPSLGVQSINAAVFNPIDFSQVGIEDLVGSHSSFAGSRRTSLVGPPGGPYTTARADAPAHEEPQEVDQTELVGASQDLSHVVLESHSHILAPGALAQDAGSEALFESVGGSECADSSTNCTLVNVNSEGTLLSRCGAVLGGGHVPGSSHNAVSTGGSRILFTAPDPYAKNAGSGCWNGGTINAPQLYLRMGGKTLKLSGAEAGLTEEGHAPLQYPVAYVGASEDDSKVYFATEAKLTKNAPASRDFELYECEVTVQAGEPTCKLTRVSAGESGQAAAGVLTVPAISADGATVYFTATGVLAAGAPTIGEGDERANLYRYQSGATTYIATIGRSDYVEFSTQQWLPHFGEIALNPQANWYTTPDGRFLLFATAYEITGANTAEASPGDCPAISSFGGNSGLPGHCAEVYRYDSADKSLVCVSCNPSGAPPTSNAQFAARSAPSTPAGGAMRAMSDDGSYAFFDTADALAPQDGNGTLDVYEWHAGQIGLISSGQDLAPSFFLGASADGANVFFGTHARLVGADTDTAGDLYDARIGGGSQNGVGKRPPCEGDACQNPPAAPFDTTPGSATFSGAGNLPAPVTSKSKPTNAQLLANALKACKKKAKRKRKNCEAHAHRRYGKHAGKARSRRSSRPSGRRG